MLPEFFMEKFKIVVMKSLQFEDLDLNIHIFNVFNLSLIGSKKTA